ncbi:hypothetical protein KDA23_02310, partial [Candidatus Saccharibacteria bacterium]|nr:hypothetical protein [Candidatus Saccharibacteria bacterium]
GLSLAFGGLIEQASASGEASSIRKPHEVVEAMYSTVPPLTVPDDEIENWTPQHGGESQLLQVGK